MDCLCDPLLDIGHHVGVEVAGHLAPDIPPNIKIDFIECLCDLLQDTGHHVGEDVAGHLAPNIPPNNTVNIFSSLVYKFLCQF
jgi:hypothetical protein